MCRTSIYIIDHVNFWSRSPRGATKKIAIKCAFLLTQTVSDDLRDNLDINRQLCQFYAHGNMLIRKFSFCSEEAKVKLFRTYTDICQIFILLTYVLVIQKHLFTNYVYHIVICSEFCSLLIICLYLHTKD